MGSTNLNPSEPLGGILNVIQDQLRLFRKESDRVGGSELLQYVGSGRFKGYIKGDLAFAAKLSLAFPSSQLYLFSFRVPSGHWNDADFDPIKVNGDIGPTDVAAYFDTDRVLAVCERRHGADKGVSFGIRVISRIWLVRSDHIPKLARDSLFSSLSVLEPPVVEVCAAGGPREMPVLDGLSDSITCGENNLVERVPSVVDGVSKPPFDGVGQRLDHSEFFDRMACAKFELSDASERIWLEEGFGGSVSLSPGVYCSVNKLLGLLECT